jgi:hypothetical protein
MRAWLEGVADEEIHLSVLVIGELRRGIELVRRREPERIYVIAVMHLHGAVSSPTRAMHDFYTCYAADVEAAQAALAPVPGQVGVLVLLEGRWIGLELLAVPDLFARAVQRERGIHYRPTDRLSLTVRLLPDRLEPGAHRR